MPTWSELPLRLVKSYSQILKWNQNHYGSGDSHGGGRFAPKDYGDDDFGEEDVDKYFTPKVKTKQYTSDPKDLHAVFSQMDKDGCLFNCSVDEMAKRWATVAPTVHPHEFLRAFFGKNGATNTNVGQLQLQVNLADKKISFAATGDELMVHGERVHDYQRVVDLENHGVEHSALKVDEARQGSGLVKKLFKSCMPLYEKLGVSHITLYANIDRGAYAWGKYGFKYYDAESRASHQKEVTARFNKVMSLPSAKDMPPEAAKERDAVAKVLKGKKDETVWALTDMKTPHLDKLFDKIIKKDSSKSNFIKLLMKNTNWSGVMDIQKGSNGRARLDQYLG